MDGLIIKPFWGQLILDRTKTWEIRGSNTTHRGKHYLIFSGTNKIFGEIDILCSSILTQQEFEQNQDKHCLPENFTWKDLIKHYKNPHKWTIGNVTLYESPIPCIQPHGAVIWIKNVKTIL